MPLKVGIVGCGPAGSMLARLLLQSKEHITVTIFEAEPGLNFRSQGGTLDLHETTGQKALKAAGLFDEFLKHARYDGEAMKLADKKLLCYVKQGAAKKGSISSTGRPEIDRPRLRELLFNSLSYDVVQWSRKLLSVEKGLEGFVLRFTDGTCESGFDLVVGADGAWSRVRKVVNDAAPFYSGVGGYAAMIPNAENNTPQLYELVNRGSLFAFGDGKSIMAQYMGDGSINTTVWAARPADWQRQCGYNVHDAEAVKAVIRQEHADWDPRLIDLVQEVQGEIVPRDLFMLPIGYRWEHVPGVTLIGDAAHLMTPFAGEGVNLALEDSLKLAEAIISAATSKQPESLHQNVAAFEQDMFIRATATQQLTYDMMQAMFFTPGAPRQGIERYILRAIEGEVGPWWTMVLTPLIYTFYFFFKLIW